MGDGTIANVNDAAASIKRGEFVVIANDDNQQFEASLVIAAEHCTADNINFMLKEARGLVCVAMTPLALDRLHIPLMSPNDGSKSGNANAFTVSVETSNLISSETSATTRAQTIRALIDPSTTVNDIASPGHTFPLRAADGGILERQGLTEASIALATLAEAIPAAVVCNIMNEDGELMPEAELQTFVAKHKLLVTTIDTVAKKLNEQSKAPPAKSNATAQQTGISLIGNSKLPTEHGTFAIQIFRDQQGNEHSLLSMGTLIGNTPLVRLHSECLTGDAFGSLRCDCGEQLQFALQRIAKDGCGALVYLRQEGRGIGLGNKIRAYELQDTGLDTVDANHQLGFPSDARVYDVAAHMLSSAGVSEVRLMTNNPDKIAGLESLGIKVTEQIAHQVKEHEHNASYLQTKATRMGHTLK